MSVYLDTPEEVYEVACALGTAVAGPGGLTAAQCALLQAITHALTDITIDYSSIEPMSADELGRMLARRDEGYRQRIVHHMVLSELILVPLPDEVATSVETYARALAIEDEFVRLARRYAKGAFGVALMDLRRSGFEQRWSEEAQRPLHTSSIYEDPFDKSVTDARLAERWRAFSAYPEGTLGRAIWTMYEMRGWDVPGEGVEQISAYLAQHDFVHVLGDYGTNLQGEIEVFSLIGRADPDPKGFAWLAAMVGLFETGYVSQLDFFQADIRQHVLQGEGMAIRLADGIRRGKAVQEGSGGDLMSVDYHELASSPLEEVRAFLHLPPKAEGVLAVGAPGILDPAGL